MNHLSIFTHDYITKHLIMITEGYSGKRMVMGLVVGDEKVLLIDAGLGMTSELREYIEGIVGSNKPILCACTHGHPMHLGSAKLFDKAYLNSRDWDIAKNHGLVNESRLSIMLDLTGSIPTMIDYCKTHHMDVTDTVFENYDDGFVFDLGGISVTALALPGHTPGSMMLWCEAENWIFSGDAISQNVSVKNLDRTGLMQYKNNLEAFIRTVPEDIAIYDADQLTKLRVKDVRALIKACEEILTGRTLNDIPGESNYSDNKNRPEMRAHFVENCSVAYDTSKVSAPRSEIDDFIFYSYEQVGERVYVVCENNGRDNALTMGLVIGDEKAMLIDTGMGMTGQLRYYIEGIVGNKPLIATCTHGNIDHLGGSIMFDDRRLNRRDWDEIGRATGTQRRFGDMGMFCMDNEEALEYCKRHWVDNSSSTFADIDAGEVFDLGGVTVEVLYSAGHTPGHLSYYIPTEKICFCGDSLNASTLIRRLTTNELGLYADNMEKLYTYIGADTRLFPGHSSRIYEAALILKVVQACREVVAGQVENDPPANILRPDKPGGLRYAHFCGNYRIIYERGIPEEKACTIHRSF